MPRPKLTRYGESKPSRKPVEQYEHTGEERLNNPPVGLMKPENDLDGGPDPQLVWAGKAEPTSFEVSTVSLHVDERFDPKHKILEPAQNGESGPVKCTLITQY